MGNIFQRIKQIREFLDFSQSKMAESIGIGTRTYSRYESGEREMSSIAISKLAQLGDFDLTWLLTGKGEMMLIDNTSHKVDIVSEPINNTLVQIPYYENIQASAGAGAYLVDESVSMMSFDIEFLKLKLGITNYKNLHTISASGDSMQPTINNGDLLFILPFENENNTIKDGAIYVLNCDSSVFVKRIRTNPIKKTLTLVSDNTDYEPIVFQGDELDMCRIVGRVTFYMGIA